MRRIMSTTPPALLEPLVTVMGLNQWRKPQPNRPIAVTCSLETKYMWFFMCSATTRKSRSEVWLARISTGSEYFTGCFTHTP